MASLSNPIGTLCRPCRRLSSERGFSLIELLIAILIIGILAAIALPAFLNQTKKADGSATKTQVGTLQTTMQAYANEHGGSFEGATLAELQRIEPTLKDTTTATASVPKAEADAFEVESVAKGGEKYKLENNKGTITRKCEPAGKGGCSAGSTW
jgi:type IV pilus assembly protein PilA